MIGRKGLWLVVNQLNNKRSQRYIHRSKGLADVATRVRRKRPPLPSKLGETLEERQFRLNPQAGNLQHNGKLIPRQYDELFESRKQELFVARDNEGNEITMDQYMKELATLSPWVGSPDAAIRKCLDIARASSTDVSGSYTYIYKPFPG